ncbi:MAG: hypothetical protein GY842_06590, partial [bacterium]|nr:hypothetical protein [bacterium]
MKATWSLMLFELRRHLPTLAVGSALLVVGPMVHRLRQGGWAYWDEEWNLAGATAALAFVPLLALMMALSGWAGERSAGTLEWLYARPLSAARIFWTRLSVILGATFAWTLVALLVNGIFDWATFSELFLALHLGTAASGLLWLELIGLLLGGGLMASALFSRSGTALLGFVMTALVLGVLVPFFLLQICPTTWALLYSGREHGLLAAGHTYGSTMALALLLAAWGAVRRAPGDRRRLSRAWKAATGVAVLGVLATLVVMLQPLRVDSSQLQGVRWLGDGTT